MARPPRSGRPTATRVCGSLLRVTGVLAIASIVCGGCAVVETVNPVDKETHLPAPTDMPPFMAGSIYEKTLLGNNTPYVVSAYGLVGRLHGTGDCTAPNTIRQYMVKEIYRRGYGDRTVPGFENISAQDVLNDPNYAIVRVDGEIPPGARKDDFFDVHVSALPNNNTTSLAHGSLFETDLKDRGAIQEHPGGAIHTFAVVKGPIFVNPAYALDSGHAIGAAKLSLRRGLIMDNGRVLQDRPLYLQLRTPEKRMARNIEARVQERFQNIEVARAQDQTVVHVYVPREFRGDWEHFAEVVQHLFLDSSPEFNAAKSQQLVEEALLPNAYLRDISYCWEGIGQHAMPFILPLLTHADQQVAFAAARAAVHIGDPSGSAEATLMRMARTSGHPFRLSSIQVLGQLPSSSVVNTALRELLDADLPVVRIEAYRILARNKDSSVYSKVIHPPHDERNQKFVLDMVQSNAPPIIYATRLGVPRIAVIGKLPHLVTGQVYATMNNRFTMNAPAEGRVVTIFYRDATRKDEKADHRLRPPIQVLSQPDLGEIIARLGGAGSRDERTLDFTYGEVVAIVQDMVDRKYVTAFDGRRTYECQFHLQEPPRIQRMLEEAEIEAGPIEPAPAGEAAVPAPATPQVTAR